MLENKPDQKISNFIKLYLLYHVSAFFSPLLEQLVPGLLQKHEINTAKA